MGSERDVGQKQRGHPGSSRLPTVAQGLVDEKPLWGFLGRGDGFLSKMDRAAKPGAKVSAGWVRLAMQWSFQQVGGLTPASSRLEVRQSPGEWSKRSAGPK